MSARVERTVPEQSPMMSPLTSLGAGSKRPRSGRAIVTYLGSVAAALVVWQLVSLTQNAYFLPSPLQVAAALGDLYRTGELFSDILASSGRILTGWALGILIGVPTGLVMGWIPLVKRLLDPYIEFFRFIPPIAFVSLAILWLGIGEESKVVLILYTSVFIMTLNTIAGVLGVDEVKLRAAASLGAGRWRTLISVVLPAIVPYIVTGARLAMGNSFLTIVSAEIVSAQTGVGALIWNARNYARTDEVFAGIILLGVMGFAFDRVIRLLSVRLFRRYGVRA